MSGSPKDAVITRDDRRAFERPCAVIHGGTRHEVVTCASLFVSTGVDPASPVKRGFEVRCEGGFRFRLVLTEGAGWEITPLPGPVLVDPL